MLVEQGRVYDYSLFGNTVPVKLKLKLKWFVLACQQLHLRLLPVYSNRTAMLKVASSKKVLCNLAWYCLACEYSPPHVGASASPDRSLCDSSPQKSILIISICPEFRHHLWMATLLCFLSLVWVKMAYSIVNSLLMFLSCISCGEPFGSLNSGQIDIISMGFFGSNHRHFSLGTQEVPVSKG